VPHARVPVLKFALGGVDFDLQFARLELERVEEDHDFSIKDFVSDPQCQASLVGHLDTTALKAAVPDILTFQTTLAGIKIWADRRGVHGYRFGFPGGISWAILVARECLANPLASPSNILQQVFTTLVEWSRSHHPLQLFPESEDPPRPEATPIMAILTPNGINSTHTVSTSSLATLQQEAKRALALIEVGSWKEVWQEASLPNLPHFLVVEARSSTAEEQVEWMGLVESKVRLLAISLERKKATEVRTWPKAFPSCNMCCRWLIGFKVPKNVRLDLSRTAKTFTEVVTKGGIQARVWKKGMEVKVEHRKRKDLLDLFGQNGLSI